MVRRVAVDIETSGVSMDPYCDDILLTSVVFDDGREFLIEGECYPAWFLELLQDQTVTKLAHNMPFETKFFLAKAGVIPTNVWDTLAIERLLTAGKEIGGNTLKQVALRRLNIHLDKTIRSNFGLGLVGEREREYCLQDSRVLLPIQEQQEREIQRNGQGIAGEIENDLSTIIGEMEYYGIGFDKDLWYTYVPIIEENRRTYMRRVLHGLNLPYQEDMFGCISGAISLSSRDAVLEALAQNGIDLPDYRSKTLFDYMLRHPECSLISDLLQYKKWDKAASWDYPQYVHTITGCIHTHWKQAQADTFRAASEKPNLMQVAKPFGDINFRHLFVAREGYKMVGADFSQIELRILIDITREPEYVEALNRGDDLHALAARNVLQRDLQGRDRDLGKAVNFGVLAFRGSYLALIGSALPYGILLTEKDARKYVKSVRSRYKCIEDWGEEETTLMMQRGFIQTPIGHRRWMPGEKRATMARNTRIQMHAAGILKDAMRRLSKRAKTDLTDAHIVLQVHDELVLEVKEEEADFGQQILEEEMIAAGEAWLSVVPCAVDSYISDTWEK